MKTKSLQEQLDLIKKILNSPEKPLARTHEYHELEIIENGWLSQRQIDELYEKKLVKSFKTSEGIFIDKNELHSYLKSNQDKGNKAGFFDNEIMRVSDVADLLGCSKGHIYNLTSQDEIPHYKKGKSLYFFYSEIQEWIMRGNL